MIEQRSFTEGEPSLYLVATPIGNLADFTFRAVEVLKQVKVCFAEDTRVSRVLFDHYDIHTKLLAYHEFNKETQVDTVLAYLAQGNDVALVSDAGMPIISDPGYLVAKKAMEAGYHVIAVPGASASLTALIVSGIAPQPFTFYGFLDSKSSKRKKELQALKEHQETLIFYESPHRIAEMLTDLKAIFGNRQIALARELTKKFEHILRGSIEEVMTHVSELKGEMVIICEGAKADQSQYTEVDSIAQVDELIVAGKLKNDAIKLVAKRLGITKQQLYKEYAEAKNE